MSLAQARDVLARANRIIANEGVLDAFGHVTMRHPSDPGRYLISRSRGPELVQPEDIVEFTLDFADRQADRTTALRRARHPRRDLQGAPGSERGVPSPRALDPAVLYFRHGAQAGLPSWGHRRRHGAVLGRRDEFGNTNLIVAKPEEGASLARALGPHWIVLMRRHGATVAGTTLEELTFRTIYSARNAALQIQAHGLGHVSPLNAEEAELAGSYNLRPGPVARAWEYWNVRLDKAEGNWRSAPSKQPKRAAPKRGKAAKKRVKRKR